MAYPMKGNRKKAREELDIVNVIEWRPSSSHEQRWFLLVRRPENGKKSDLLIRTLPGGSNRTGLLAGLYEFPTTANVAISISSAALLKQTNDVLSKYIETAIQPFDPRQKKREVLSFRKTYRVQWVILEGGQGPPQLSTELNAKNAEPPDPAANITRGGRWYHLDEVSGAKSVSWSFFMFRDGIDIFTVQYWFGGNQSLESCEEKMGEDEYLVNPNLIHQYEGR